jgi:ribosomal protein S6--L-glutamate ligase
MTTLHIGILVETRYRSQLQPAGLEQALRHAGHDVTVIDPQRNATSLTDAHSYIDAFDVVVARGRSWEVLCLLSLAESRGIPTINPQSGVAAVHNKSLMAVALARAGVQTPSTFLGGAFAVAQACQEARAYPVVVKPIFGDNGSGLALARTAHDLLSIDTPYPWLAQAFVPDSCEVKVYGIGDDVWTVRRAARFAAHGTDVRTMPQPADANYCALARRCRDLFGLDAYGVDCIETPGGPVVIEVNEFPNYAGIADASERLADLVVSAAFAGQPVRRIPCVSRF